MICSKCGMQVEENSLYCANCGNKIERVNNSNNGFVSNNRDANNSHIIINNDNVQSVVTNSLNDAKNDSLISQENMNMQQYNDNQSNFDKNTSYNADDTVAADNWSSDKKNNPTKKEKKSIISLIFGIISLILSIFINILILPISIAGLVLGIKCKNKSGKKIAGIILNSFSIFIAITFFAGSLILNSTEGNNFLNTLYNELDYASSENYVSGKYDCKGVDSSSDKYLITLNLNADGTFLYGPYENTENNYAKGAYTYEDEKKTDNTGNYKYFMITLTGSKEDFIQDGVASDHDFKSKLEFGLTNYNGKKQGVIMFTNTYNMYYCYEK